MKKTLVLLMVFALFFVAPAQVFAQEPFFLWKIDLPGVVALSQEVDGRFYISLSAGHEGDFWADVEYSSEIGECSLVSSRLFFQPGVEKMVPFIIRSAEQSGYFTVTVAPDSAPPQVFEKWIIVDPDPDRLLQVSARRSRGHIVVDIQSRLSSAPDGLWYVMRETDPYSGPVVFGWIGPSGINPSFTFEDEVRSIRGGNSIRFVVGETYLIQVWREPYSTSPPYLTDLVMEKSFTILPERKLFLPIFSR